MFISNKIKIIFLFFLPIYWTVRYQSDDDGCWELQPDISNKYKMKL